MTGDNKDKDKAGAGRGWTDKERLTYLFALIENSNVKFDYNNTPRPADRTIAACRIMVGRLKATLKDELAALQNGDASPKASPDKPAATPRKRKPKLDADDVQDTPSKRKGKKVKTEDEVMTFAGEDDEMLIKVESENKEPDLEDTI